MNTAATSPAAIPALPSAANQPANWTSSKTGPPASRRWVARVPFGQVVTGVTPFLVGQIVLLFLLVLVPQIVTAPLEWLR